jgi:hypothetical protein
VGLMEQKLQYTKMVANTIQAAICTKKDIDYIKKERRQMNGNAWLSFEVLMILIWNIQQKK